MRISDKLTDEELARLVDCGIRKDELDFSDLSSFEAFTVAEKAMKLVDEVECVDCDACYDMLPSDNASLICSFFADVPNDDDNIDLGDGITDDNDDDIVQ